MTTSPSLGREPGLPWTGRSALLALAAASIGCATTVERVPLEDPAASAARLHAAVPDRPHRVTFRWQYADERGPVRGDGVLRFNPPDSLRLDLFSTGDASLRVALVDGEVRSAGGIEDVRLPPPAFLYATAGLFRPGRAGPAEGWSEGEERVLVYDASPDGSLVYRLRGSRITSLEERNGNEAVRRLELEWAEPPGTWPLEAEYRDPSRSSRARWTVEDAQAEEEAFPREIYELSAVP